MLYINKESCPEDVARKISEIIVSGEWRAVPDPADRTLSEPQRKTAVDSLRNFFDSLDKDAIRKALLKEQHGLCAYCMKRIENNGLHTTIEHWQPLSKGKNNALDYLNFLGTCKGGSDISGLTRSQRVICCDAQKNDNDSITINPLNKRMMEGITYSDDGIIEFHPIDSFDVTAIQTDIDTTLRLNGKLDSGHKCTRDTSTQLVFHRRKVYKNTEQICLDQLDRGMLTTEWLRAQIEKSFMADEWEEFVGVSVYVYTVYLERLLKQAGRK